jgi:hypothetical protein
MVRWSALSEVNAANTTEVESQDRVESVMEVARTIGADKVPTASDDEKCLLSLGGTDNSLGEGASDDENSWTYNFRTSTITIGRMKEMVEKGYFVDGEAHTPRAEAVPDSDEAGMYEGFFVAGLHMPLHLALADILLKFRVQMHQLMPNAIAQLSK